MDELRNHRDAIKRLVELATMEQCKVLLNLFSQPETIWTAPKIRRLHAFIKKLAKAGENTDRPQLIK